MYPPAILLRNIPEGNVLRVLRRRHILAVGIGASICRYYHRVVRLWSNVVILVAMLCRCLLSVGVFSGVQDGFDVAL